MKPGSVKIGVNTHPNQIQQALSDLQIGWVRIVWFPEEAVENMVSILQDLKNRGLKIILVLASESLGWGEWKNNLDAKLVEIYNKTKDFVEIYEIGNEPDQRSPSSWDLSFDDFNILSKAAKNAMPDKKRIVGGLVSGDPNWLRGIKLGQRFHGIAIHPYGKRPTPDWPDPHWGFGFIGELLDDYRKVLAELGHPEYPLYITEYGTNAAETGQDLQARYIRKMTSYLLARGDVYAATVFCLSDAMVPEFGLYNADWTPKDAARRLVNVLEETAVFSPLVEPTPEPPAPPTPPNPEPVPATPTKEDVIKAGVIAAVENAIPEELMIALGIAESNLTWNAERWAYWDGEKTINHTTRAKAAIAAGNWNDLDAVIVEITTMGSNDISFGAWQQTVRWADEGDHSQTRDNILYIRDLYFNPMHAAQKAAARIVPYWLKYRDTLEALCRYNKPAIPGNLNPNRANYQRGLDEARNLLNGGTPEPPGDYTPTVYNDQGSVAGSFQNTPKGIVLHGTRSGQVSHTIEQEFNGTRNFATQTDLGWNITVGEDKISIHMDTNQWGWHARRASGSYLSIEFAQPTQDFTITDAQIRAAAWWIKNHALKAFPNLPLNFPTHAEIEASGETGMRDGKTDVYPFGDARVNVLRQKLLEALNQPAQPTDAELLEARRIVIDHLTGPVADALEAAIRLPQQSDMVREATNVLNEIRRHRHAAGT